VSNSRGRPMALFLQIWWSDPSSFARSQPVDLYQLVPNDKFRPDANQMFAIIKPQMPGVASVPAPEIGDMK